MPVFLTEALLYAAFLAGDTGLLALPFDTAVLKYAAVCLLAAWALYGYAKRRRFPELVLAAVLIPAADYVLLFAEERAAAGVAVFTAVQACYLRHLTRGKSAARRAAAFAVFAAVFAAGFAAAKAVMAGAGATERLAAGYILVFAGNLALAVRAAVRERSAQAVCFAAGVALFFLCDVHVGLYNIRDLFDGGLHAYASGFAGTAMWLFYLPGQCLITALPAATKTKRDAEAGDRRAARGEGGRS